MQKRKKELFVVLLVVIMILGLSTLAFTKQENETNVEQDVIQRKEVTVEIGEEEVPLSDSVVEIEDEDTPLEIKERLRPIWGLIIVFAIIVISYIFLKNYVRSREDLDSVDR